jgi:hypothetical protein
MRRFGRYEVRQAEKLEGGGRYNTTLLKLLKAINGYGV